MRTNLIDFPDNHSGLVEHLFLLLTAGICAGRVKPSRVDRIMELAAASHCGTVQLMIDELITKLDP